MPTALAVCAVGVLVAGCGSPAGDGGGGDAAGKRPSSPAASSTAPSPDASPSPTASTSPTASPSPTYTATKDLSTCYDGRCTVEVEEGAVIPFGGDVRLPDLTIDAVGESGVDMTAAGGGMVLRLSGQTPEQGGASRLNETAIAVLAITGDAAVLDIYPADEVPA